MTELSKKIIDNFKSNINISWNKRIERYLKTWTMDTSYLSILYKFQTIKSLELQYDYNQKKITTNIKNTPIAETTFFQYISIGFFFNIFEIDNELQKKIHTFSSRKMFVKYLSDNSKALKIRETLIENDFSKYLEIDFLRIFKNIKLFIDYPKVSFLKRDFLKILFNFFLNIVIEEKSFNKKIKMFDFWDDLKMKDNSDELAWSQYWNSNYVFFSFASSILLCFSNDIQTNETRLNSNIDEGISDRVIGSLGEQIFFTLFSDEKGHVKNFEYVQEELKTLMTDHKLEISDWQSKIDAYSPYDFVHNEIMLEIKSSRDDQSKKPKSFHLSENELHKMENNKEKYFIVKVHNLDDVISQKIDITPSNIKHLVNVKMDLIKYYDIKTKYKSFSKGFIFSELKT